MTFLGGKKRDEALFIKPHDWKNEVSEEKAFQIIQLMSGYPQKSQSTQKNVFLFQYKYLSPNGMGLFSSVVTEKFQFLYKNTNPSRHTETNQQLIVCPASNISPFVFQTSPRSSLMVCKSITHIFAALGELRQRRKKKRSFHFESFKAITKRINSKGRSKDPRVIFSLVYSSHCLLPVQSIPITPVCNRAHSRGLDPSPTASCINCCSQTRYYAA